MLPTEVLQHEHRIIEQVLTCLERMVTECRRTGRLKRSAASQAIEFFRTFADGCHHRKEEDLLFPMMESRGFPRQGGPTGVMLSEHEEGRRLIRGMSDWLDAAARGEPKGISGFEQAALAYTQLLRAHIAKEDHCLFPMACGALGPEEQDSLCGSFVALDREVPGQGVKERGIEIANRLADEFGVTRVCEVDEAVVT